MNNDDLPEPASGAAAESGRELSPDQALALDLALGILVDPLRGRAVDRCARDITFSNLVAGYREMLDRGDVRHAIDLDDGAGTGPSEDTWAAIQARIGRGKDS